LALIAPGPQTDLFFMLRRTRRSGTSGSGRDWPADVVSPETRVLTDLADGKLAQA